MAYVNDGPSLFLTADRSEVVEEGDPRAAFLLVAHGGSLPDEEAAKYGLGTKAKAAPAVEFVPDPALVEQVEDAEAAEKSRPKPQDKNKTTAPPNKSKG